MELTRNWKSLRSALLMLVFGGLLLASPWLLEQVGRAFVLGPWVGYIGGGITVLVGIVTFLDSLRRYRIGVSENGLDLVVAGFRGAVSWDQVDAVVVETDRGQEKNPSVLLVLIPAAGVPVGKADYTSNHQDRQGMKLIALDEVAQGPQAVADAMMRFAGPKFIELAALPAPK